MNRSDCTTETDMWSDWLLHTRYAGDPDQERSLRTDLQRYADRVLDGARLVSGMTLADIGAGDGLIAFRAIERVGPSLRVHLTDISAPLLRHADALAIQRGVRGQCTFVHGSAEVLKGIDAASVDAVTTRAVLAYVPDKIAAMREFHRILRPGGRLSIAEPILRDDAFEASSLKKIVDALPQESGDQFFHLLHRWKAAQFPDTDERIAANPITNFGERDLVRFALDAGFTEVHMEFHIDVGPSGVASWEILLGTSPHPLAPTLGTILSEQFTAEERLFFEQVFRPQVEGRRLATADRTAYLTATKPQL
ncbi:class I SAM-dependent methyltransferase [Paraburkholderia sediminicola]|uniref:class I SAM-dependent methyltransferase n=1 Tax=Paraburkholderia sediminicola TaxID=458836 RepID=UPI0038B8AFE1